MTLQDDNTEEALVKRASKGKETVRVAPASAGESLARDAAEGGGSFKVPPEHEGAVGRTTFDDRSSEDGTITVVLPPDSIDITPSQGLLKITSLPDRKEYVATVTAGPFCEPDGMRADAPALIASAVNGVMAMPRHHGRVQATIIGQKLATGIMPARFRPKPNSPVHRIPDAEMAGILNLNGDVRLGLAYGHDSVHVCIPSKEKSVLPRHTAAVGTTGSGKSTGVGCYVAGLQGAGNCVFLFDVEGEYTKLDQPTDNPQLIAALGDRGLAPQGVLNTHLYHLVGRDCANPSHPSRHAFSLRFSEISPYAFAEIMDLNTAQEDRLLQAYELAKLLMRQLGVFPRKGKQEEKADLDLTLGVDEFERGWPRMTLDHLCYLVSGVINVAEGKPEEEPSYAGASGFHGQWSVIRSAIISRIGGGSEDEDDEPPARGKKKSNAPKFGQISSWKAVSSRITRIRKLSVFDRDAGGGQQLRYEQMIAPGRVNIIDLSDLENTDVRNLAIAEVLRGISMRQQDVYDSAVKKSEKPLPTNVIIEEAHEFLSAKRVTKMPTLRDQLTRIAKRGRKRYLGLTFVTQSPNDLPDEVLGLVNNWIIYKIDDPIIRRLRSFVPNADDSLWHHVRGLGQGQAVTSFTHMKRPVITAMDPSPAMLRMAD